MLIKELRYKDCDNRMELGPESDEYYIYVKCDRCGIVQSDLPDICTNEFDFNFQNLLWYCSDFKRSFGLYDFLNADDNERIDYCPKCIKTDEERKVVLRGMSYALRQFYQPVAFSIGRQLERLIEHQTNFQKLCFKYINALSTFDASLGNISVMERQIKQALNRSIVKFPTYKKLQYVQMTLYEN